jgi:hypothetical protein
VQETAEVLGPIAVLVVRGDATPVLAIPRDDVELTNRETDFPDTWALRNLFVIAESQPNGYSGKFLVTSGGLFHDPYVGALGARFPGIRANEQLARNVIKWLTDGLPPEPPDPAQEAFRLADQIERNLAEYVVGRLQMSHANWWTEGVPLQIRTACAQRSEEDENRYPKEAYLDLLHYSKIVEHNFSLYEVHLRAVGWSRGKKKALAWIGELNKIRRAIMHPTRRFFDSSLTQEHLAFLADTNNETYLHYDKMTMTRTFAELRDAF